MKAYDFEACTYQGDVYCNGCLPRGLSVNSEEVTPIFASDEWEHTPVCCQCMEPHDYMSVLFPNSPRFAVDDSGQKWDTCQGCGEQMPEEHLDGRGLCDGCA